MRNFLDKYLPPVLWTLVIALATWGSWVMVTGGGPAEVPEGPPKNEPVQTIPPAVMDRPMLQEITANGSVTWTLYLDRIVREENSVMELARPRALYQFQSGEVLEVTSDTGTYDENARVLELSGSVTGHARQEKFELTAGRMIWDANAGTLNASEGIEIVRAGIVFRGESVRLDLSKGFTRMEVEGGDEGVQVSSTEGALEELKSLE